MKFLIIILLSFRLLAQTTYYIKDDGNDSNTGLSDAQAWLTLSKIQSTVLQPGDSVLFKRGDTWTGQQCVLAESGSEGNPIVFATYGSGDDPLIDNNNTHNNYIFRLNSGVGYYEFHDLEVTRLSMTGAGSLRGAFDLEQGVNNILFKRITNTTDTQQSDVIWLGGGFICMLDANNITVDSCDVSGTHYGIFGLANYNNSNNDTYNLTFTNNVFHDFDPRTAGASNPLRGRAIALMTWWDNDPDAPGDGSTPGTEFGAEGTIRDVLIDNNIFTRIISNCVDWYWHYNFVTSGVKGYNWTITNNTFDNNAFNAVDLAPIGWRGGQADWSIFRGNTADSSGWDWTANPDTVYNIPDEGYVNVIQTHVWDHWIIEDNIITNVAQTSGDGSALILDYSISASTYKCDTIVIRNNWFEGCIGSSDPGVGETSAAAIQLFTSRYAQVYNNILIDNNHGVGTTNQTTDALIYNNTINGNTDAGGQGGGHGIYTAGCTNTEIKNNIISNNEALGIRKGGTQTGFSADYNLQFNNSGTDASGANDVLSDPLFTGAGDYSLQETSPAIDAGTTITGDVLTRMDDYIGTSVPINSVWDIGAYEWFEVLPPAGNKIRALLRIKQ